MNPSTNPTDAGTNRTGIATSPLDSKASIEGAHQGSPRPDTDPGGLVLVRVTASRGSPPVGTVPPPASLKGAVKTGLQTLVGHDAKVLIDLVADRLAFERTGVRLYEALLVKLEAADFHPGGPTRDDLETICQEELSHVGLLTDALARLGGDPTSLTPMADITAVASSGLAHVLADPRTTLTQGLHAVHLAELADNDGWLMLADLTSRLGHDEMAVAFREALIDEERHLANVRSWLSAAIDHQAGLSDENSAESSTEPATL